jgi:hypothetical protein
MRSGLDNVAILVDELFASIDSAFGIGAEIHFRDFVCRSKSTRWLISADFVIDEAAAVYDTFAFTVFPNDALVPVMMAEIGQQQVHSTERYMSTNAMRPICFVLSREPPHRHALIAAYGALREGGKLLVFLSDDDLIEMLKLRDAQLTNARLTNALLMNEKLTNVNQTKVDIYQGYDPSIVIEQKIYKFLAETPR